MTLIVVSVQSRSRHKAQIPLARSLPPTYKSLYFTSKCAPDEVTHPAREGRWPSTRRQPLWKAVTADLNASDYYQGAHLVNQAVNELCPAQTWQLRQSAAGYRVAA
jgi:hypothetical protein